MIISYKRVQLQGILIFLLVGVPANQILCIRFQLVKTPTDKKKGITQPEQRLSFRYNFDYVETMNQQLLKGGVRLAGLLNELFG